MSELHKFMFDGLPVRGAIVRLDDAWVEILRRRAANSSSGAYPLPLQNLLGEMAAAPDYRARRHAVAFGPTTDQQRNTNKSENPLQVVRDAAQARRLAGGEGLPEGQTAALGVLARPVHELSRALVGLPEIE